MSVFSVEGAVGAAIDQLALTGCPVRGEAYRWDLLVDIGAQESVCASFGAAVAVVADERVRVLREAGANEAECVSERLSVLYAARAEVWERGLAEMDAARGRMLSRWSELTGLAGGLAWGGSGGACGCAAPGPLPAP
jgi:hypothetical protein